MTLIHIILTPLVHHIGGWTLWGCRGPLVAHRVVSLKWVESDLAHSRTYLFGGIFGFRNFQIFGNLVEILCYVNTALSIPIFFASGAVWAFILLPTLHIQVQTPCAQ